MRIEQEDNGLKGRFYIKEDDEYPAQMVYLWAGKEKIIIEHTEVDEKYKGQGVGMKLLAELVAWARKEQVKIIPLCPFAKAAMEKRAEEYKDVLYHQGT
ncbi:MAG: GNAT family N-acetyltransferase [Bacteroidetes bacterium 46-16]|nr:MAG: GNAT family N-acetyltransferase [Bacteroidetes bacterium 46-16]